MQRVSFKLWKRNYLIQMKLSPILIGVLAYQSQMYGKVMGLLSFLSWENCIKLKTTRTRPMRKKGDVTLMIEWSWRIESHRSILVGSFDSIKTIESKILKLRNKTVKNISLVCRLPEIYVGFSDNYWLHSFATSSGQPEWGVLFHNGGWLEVKRGKVYFVEDKN